MSESSEATRADGDAVELQPAGAPRVEWAWGLGTALVALAVYVATLPPSITFEDSGGFATAAALPGIAHPSGYPLYTVLAHAFTYLPFGSVAWRVNLFSAVCAAAAAGVLFAVARRLGVARPAAAAAGLLAAFSRTLWSQAVVAEVYTLHVLCLALLLLVIASWRATGRPAWLYAFALVLGLACGNHHLIVLFAASLVPAMAWTLWRTPGRRPPDAVQLGKAAGLFALGLCVYLYLPLRSAMDPLLDWGNPETWENFWAVVRRVQFEAADRAAGVALHERLSHVGVFLSHAVHVEFSWLALPAILVGAAVLWRRSRVLALCTLGVVLLNTLVLVFVLAFPFEPSKVFVFRVYYVGAYWVLALWAAFGLDALVRASARPVLHGAASVLVLALPLAAAAWSWRVNDLSSDDLARRHASALLATLERDAVLVGVQNDVDVFPLLYAQRVEHERPDVAVFDRFALVFNRFEGDVLVDRVMTRSSELADYRERLLARLRASGRPIYHAERPEEDLEVVPAGIFYREVRPGEAFEPEHRYERLYGELLELEPEGEWNLMARYVPGRYHLLRGLRLDAEGRRQSADRELERAREFASGQRELLELMTLRLNETGRLELGRACFHELVDLLPPSQRRASFLDYHFSRLEYFEGADRMEDYYAELEAILDIDPSYPPALQPYLKLSFDRGRELAIAGKFDEARPILQRALELGAEPVQTSSILSICLYETGEPGRALQLLEGLVQDAPDDVQVWHNLAVLLQRMGHQQRLQEVLRIIARLDPDHPLARGVTDGTGGR